MADNKKNNNKSKYNRYEKQNSNSSGKKKGNSKGNLEVEYLEDLDSTRNLDISFVDGIKKKKKIEEKTEILDVAEINKANAEFRESIDLNARLRLCSYLLLILVVVCVCFLIFTIYHFSNFDHSKVEVKENLVNQKDKVIDDNYVFIGDQITMEYDLEKYFNNMHVVNSSGKDYDTDYIIKNFNDLIYKYNPSKIFLLIGINDIKNGVSDDKIVDNIKTIVEKIKDSRPYSMIYLESIYPVIDIDGISGETIRKLNDKLETLCEEEDITYIDIYSNLVDKNGNLMSKYSVDGLHISDSGYEKITSILEKYIKN